MNDSEYAPDGWTTTTIRNGQEMHGAGRGDVWVWRAGAGVEGMDGYITRLGVAEDEWSGRKVRAGILRRTYYRTRELWASVGWSTPAGRGCVVWKMGGGGCRMVRWPCRRDRQEPEIGNRLMYRYPDSNQYQKDLVPIILVPVCGGAMCVDVMTGKGAARQSISCHRITAHSAASAAHVGSMNL